ncbi:SulP family inorganic anion transporter [Allonocardiopsis opalescens]|uniref:Carbonic anhydrase n=1 Tax=Allonocardiopsis opalescens TaxID=1144618 RepID=A0A2T0PU72_9ACTN|nr:SulP family inorganic anion transporter [Allonocardiopsis opalescens]PRX92452.1 carbonic anhydrase [Allonocardiopsis opalescens]
MRSAVTERLRTPLRELRHDLPASFVVLLVAIPLSLGIAVASGAPLAAGLIAAAVGGIVAGSLGGSAVQVSGPAAGLTVVVAELILQYGWPAMCFITTLAGLVQMALGGLRTARAALAISPSVVHGMLGGVGIVLALSQVHVMMGGAPSSTALANLQEIPFRLLDADRAALAVGAVTLAVLLVWTRLPRIGRVDLTQLPGPLVAIAVATAATEVLGWQVVRVDLPASFADAWHGPALPEGDLYGIGLAVLTVALVSSVQSLLCAIAVDRMHTGPRARLDRELVGQGAANLVSGGLGGLPVAGVGVRGVANVRAGGRSRMSTIAHGVWVALFSLALVPVIEAIPLPALAALLVYLGISMVDLDQLRELRAHRESSVYVLTLLGVTLIGVIEGVAMGLVLAALIALRRLARLRVRAAPHGGEQWLVLVEGSLTFLAVPKLIHELRRVPAGADVSIHLQVDFMDHAGFEGLRSWRRGHELGGGTVTVDEGYERWYDGAATGTPPPHRTLPVQRTVRSPVPEEAGRSGQAARPGGSRSEPAAGSRRSLPAEGRTSGPR